MLAVDTDLSNNKVQPGTLVAVLDADMRVVAQIDGAAVPALSVAVPPGGSALVGGGAAGDWLRRYAHGGSAACRC